MVTRLYPVMPSRICHTLAIRFSFAHSLQRTTRATAPTGMGKSKVHCNRGMTNIQRYRRRVEALNLSKEGMSPDVIAKKLVMGLALVQKIIRYGPDWQARCPAPEIQKANVLEAQKLHEAWRKDHVKRCADYPGTCAGKHRLMDLYDVNLPGDTYAFVCRSKLEGNWEAFGYGGNPMVNKQSPEGVARNRAYMREYYRKNRMEK